MWKKCWLGLVSILLMVGLFGCKVEEMDVEKVKDLDFTVMKEVDIPEELMKMIDEQKEATMQLSYSDGNFLYLVAGYGEQKTGGYSIVVEELYLTKNAIYLNTNLLGPKQGTKVKKTPTQPYLVVKMEYLDMPVVYS